MIVRKLLVSDGRTEREVLLVGTIVVGRDPSCQLNDLDPLLSRRHAEFVPSGKGVTVRDLKSRNGILVNGSKVPEQVLSPGDVIQLGHLHVRYVEEPVVKSPEDHTRVRAKTETGIEVPTMAPISKAASAPTTQAPIPVDLPAPSSIDDTDLDMTVAPLAKGLSEPVIPELPKLTDTALNLDLDATVAPRHVPSAPPIPELPKFQDDDLNDDATVASVRHAAPPAPKPAATKPTTPPDDDDDDDEVDADATIAPGAGRPVAPSYQPAPMASARTDHEGDATRAPMMKAPAAVADPDSTVAISGRTFEETRATPRAPVTPPPGRAPLATEARVVANGSLVITEASPSCQTVIGARPDTIVGGQLGAALARTLMFVATGDGPSALSVQIVRTPSGMMTVTFKAGTAN